MCAGGANGKPATFLLGLRLSWPYLCEIHGRFYKLGALIVWCPCNKSIGALLFLGLELGPQGVLLKDPAALDWDGHTAVF